MNPLNLFTEFSWMANSSLKRRTQIHRLSQMSTVLWVMFIKPPGTLRLLLVGSAISNSSLLIFNNNLRTNADLFENYECKEKKNKEQLFYLLTVTKTVIKTERKLNFITIQI